MAEPSKGLGIGGSRYFWKFGGWGIKEDWLKAVEKKKDFQIPQLTRYCFSHWQKTGDLSGEDKIEGPSGTLEGRDTIKQS